MPTVSVKRCPRCNESKPVSEFYWNKGRPQGRCKECYRAWHLERHTPKVPVPEHITCAVCGKTYRPKQRRPTKYCSTFCKNQARILSEKAARAERMAQKRCEWCAGPMARERGDAKFCCSDCMTRAQRARRIPKERAAYRFLKKYSITLEERAALLEKQGGGCAICHTTHPGSRGWALDHDHACCPDTRNDSKTCGQCVRGVLCGRCNLALGLLDDDPARLRAAASYLKRHSK